MSNDLTSPKPVTRRVLGLSAETLREFRLEFAGKQPPSLAEMILEADRKSSYRSTFRPSYIDWFRIVERAKQGIR
jgi:hypothetical protein